MLLSSTPPLEHPELIQSVSQVTLPRLRESDELGGIASFHCPKAPLPQLILI